MSCEQSAARQRRRRLEGEPGDAAGVGRDALDVVRDERRREHQPQVARHRRLQGHRTLDGAASMSSLRGLRAGRARGDDVVRRLRVGIAEQVDGAPQQRHRLLARCGDRRVELLELAPQRLAHAQPNRPVM